MLMKNTHRQEACSIRNPPRTGPTAAVMDVKPDHVPIARPRFSRGNDALMMARLPGTSIAAPIPCSPRARINWPILGARPHQIEDAAKRETPAAYIRLRP